jgi:hypothetical protein
MKITSAAPVKEGKNLRLAVKSGALIPALLTLPNVAWMLFYNFNAVPQVSAPWPFRSLKTWLDLRCWYCPFFTRSI